MEAEVTRPQAKGLTVAGMSGGRPRNLGEHRTLVYCNDDTPSVYAKAYGWWCMDCPETQDPETDPTTKANAERNAGRHRRRAGSRFRTAPLTERQSA